MRFLWFYEEYYHVSDQRGQIQKHNYQRIAHKHDAQSSSQTSGYNNKIPRVACAINIFCNIIHEGLVFLSRLWNGEMVLNQHTRNPLKYVKGMDVIITMFYSNDALICFSGMLRKATSNLILLQKYSKVYGSRSIRAN